KVFIEEGGKKKNGVWKCRLLSSGKRRAHPRESLGERKEIEAEGERDKSTGKTERENRGRKLGGNGTSAHVHSFTRGRSEVKKFPKNTVTATRNKLRVR